MAKKKEKTEKQDKKEKTEKPTVKKYTLVELVIACPTDMIWIIYNLSRVGLLEQYRQEAEDYGIKDITPSLTIEEFNKIINGA